jgi:RNA polymerase sigma factor (sigma-70 family)
MRAVTVRQALGSLRRTLPLVEEGRLSDGQLLERFVAERDEAAFAALVRRHGPMVLGVCRRVLGHHHDAEDAFQATFLVLARKAAGVRRESLASWLYTVAYHAALEARAANARRRARERQVQDMPHPEVKPAPAQDWRPLLDHELHGLPEKYRTALILCELEGKSRKEAARLLRLAEGTLSSRLATARRLLARGLARHGLSLSGAVLAAALAEGAAPAAVPASLVSSTVGAATLLAGGSAAGAASPAVGLMKGVLKAMLLTKLKVVAVAVVMMTLLGTGGLAYRVTSQAAPAEDKVPADLEALRKENELLRLNIQVLLEKIRAQEAELAALRGHKPAEATGKADGEKRLSDARHRMQSLNHLKQLALAFHNYHDTYGSFPPAALGNAEGKPLLSWRVAILPFIEQGALYKQLHLDEPWDSEHNKKLLDKMPRIYELPGVHGIAAGHTAYQVFVGKDALFEGGRKPRIADITDGTSNTILVVEGARPVPWTRPDDIPLGDRDPRTQVGGWYDDLLDVALCDGSARSVDRKKISEETFRHAIMPRDGNVLGKDWE